MQCVSISLFISEDSKVFSPWGPVFSVIFMLAVFAVPPACRVQHIAVYAIAKGTLYCFIVSWIRFSTSSFERVLSAVMGGNCCN